MKQLLLLIALLCFSSHSFSQNISCQELFETVTSKYDYKTSVNCFGSSMLVKAEYYQLENMGFVVAYIKENEYDITGDPYIFCGISSQRWNSFKSEGFSSWGKSFHKYIRDYTCNCY